MDRGNGEAGGIAGSQPQAAYAAYIHGTQHKWNYICQTVPNCGHLLQPLEDCIHQKHIPALSGQLPYSNSQRDLLALPAKLGGLGLVNPTATPRFEASLQITQPLNAGMLCPFRDINKNGRRNRREDSTPKFFINSFINGNANSFYCTLKICSLLRNDSFRL